MVNNKLEIIYGLNLVITLYLKFDRNTLKRFHDNIIFIEMPKAIIYFS